MNEKDKEFFATLEAACTKAKFRTCVKCRESFHPDYLLKLGITTCKNCGGELIPYAEIGVEYKE